MADRLDSEDLQQPTKRQRTSENQDETFDVIGKQKETQHVKVEQKAAEGMQEKIEITVIEHKEEKQIDDIDKDLFNLLAQQQQKSNTTNNKNGDDEHTADGQEELYDNITSDTDSDSGKDAKEISKEELNARRMAVFESLTNLQMDRYECFRRASFQKSKMARVMKYVLRQNVNERMIISMQGIAKLFVGELIECARKVAMERQDTGPIKPSHIHTAYQTLSQGGKIPSLSPIKRPF
eukprot:TRINITY_DN10021_c1_g1_i2.p1 TRINITY_DN10021_c1_g1~~TRINITY_DN10021_c1_g1_i2.p1  ORF type:complete len:237 (+),score=34.54 TRINITY_DN10021_c1_g1_i2:73-783(+)